MTPLTRQSTLDGSLGGLSMAGRGGQSPVSAKGHGSNGRRSYDDLRPAPHHTADAATALLPSKVVSTRSVSRSPSPRGAPSPGVRSPPSLGSSSQECAPADLVPANAGKGGPFLCKAVHFGSASEQSGNAVRRAFKAEARVQISLESLLYSLPVRGEGLVRSRRSRTKFVSYEKSRHCIVLAPPCLMFLMPAQRKECRRHGSPQRRGRPRGYEAFSRGDMETLRELFADDIARHVPGGNPLAGD